MTNYTKATNFASKDALASGNSLKIVKGTEIDTEFNSIATAVNSKLDGTGGALVSSTVDSSPVGATTPSTGAFTTLSATGVTTLSGATTISNALLPVIDNIKLGYTTTATAAGTTTLTSTSTHQQYFTGSTTQTIVLPVTSTLALGLSYLIVNNSTGVLTVQSSGANTITTVPANTSVKCTCILITGTTAASWTFVYENSSNLPYKQLPTITATVATNILTLGLNPCLLDFRSSTAGSGTSTVRNITTAISMTVSNGSTLGTLNGVLSKLAVLAIDNAGTVELAVVNTNTYGLLDERNLISTTAEGGIGAADSGTVIYSTTARSSVPFRIVGYVESTQATAGAYATAPSNIAGMGGAIVPQPIPILVSGSSLTTTISPTSGTSLDFIGIPSWAKRITIMFGGISFTATASLILQVGTSGGIVSSGYLGSTNNFSSAPSATYPTTYFGLDNGVASTDTAYGNVSLCNLTGNTWIESHSLGVPPAGGVCFGGGGIALGGVLDRIRITTVAATATFDAGSVNILFE